MEQLRAWTRRRQPPRFARARFLRAVAEFARTEASGGVILLAAALVALAWANSPWDEQYFDLWNAHLALDLNRFRVDLTLGHAVNDGLMTVFFFVVGLEIKRELVHGELSTKRKAALPVAAALGGMTVPALIYAALNAGGEGSRGWGIPMATDIAFAMGILALLGPRVPFSLRVFLLALAIVDDLGAIMVIAIFYTESLSGEALAWAGAVLALVLGLRKAGVRSTDVYVVAGLLFWLAVFKSGIHATLAGVVLAMLTPARPQSTGNDFATAASDLFARYQAAQADGDNDRVQQLLREMETLSRRTESPLDRLEHFLHPWTSYLVVPLFALANAGVALSGELISDALSSRVSLGIVLGLVAGKPLGIIAACFVASRLGLATMPSQIGFAQILGAGLVAGVGFTVSLFVTGLAFENAALAAEAKVGILSASVVAGVAGFAYLRIVEHGRVPEPAEAAGH
jgi:Na+:H+ antiporter, NhaA family